MLIKNIVNNIKTDIEEEICISQIEINILLCTLGYREKSILY